MNPASFAENRLVSRSNGTTLSYDPLGRLWRTSGQIETTTFEYDGDRLVEEFDASGTRIRVYGHGPGTDEPLLWWEGPTNWQRRYFHADHQGSVIAIANDNGAPQRINGTDAWGIRNSGDWGRFGLTGQVFLADLGMYYYKARIYSPTLGRFLQTDPVGYEGGPNLYDYAQSDPLNHTDPTGNNPAAVGIVVVEGAEACAANPLCRTVAIWTVKQIVRALVPVLPHPPPRLPHPTPTMPQEAKATPAAGTTSEARRLGRGPYRCSNPLCDAHHGGVTGTTECPECDGRRRRGDQVPGRPRPLPPVPPKPKPATKD